jgi:hypothetical protein
MWIETEYSPDLNSIDIRNFAADMTPGRPTRYLGARPTLSGYQESAARKAPARIVDFYAIRRERYNVTRRGVNIVGSFSVDVPILQPLSIEITAHLFIKIGVSGEAATEISRAFLDYDAQRDGDPIGYVAARLDGDVRPDMFRTRNSFTLEQAAGRSEFTERRDSLLALYVGGGNGVIDILPDASLGELLRDEAISAVLIDTEIVGAMEAPQGEHREIDSGADPDQLISEIVSETSKGIDCIITSHVRERISTLLSAPEYKIEWELLRVIDDCGVRVEIKVPVLYDRRLDYALYAWFANSKDILAIVEQAAKTCLIRSALNPAVIGLAFVNLPAAAIAFAVAFIDCVNYHGPGYAKCLIPDIAVVHERTDWHRVL